MAGSTGSRCRTCGAACRRPFSSTSTATPIMAARIGHGSGSFIKRTSRAAIGRLLISAALCRTSWRSSGAIATPAPNGSGTSRRWARGATATTTPRARRWSSARKTGIGGSCMCISRKRPPRRDRAASDRRVAMQPGLPRIGVRLDQELDPHRCIELAVAVEAGGYSSLWFAENPLHRAILPALSACALHTERISLGIGIVNVYQHHPSLIAMEAGALDELAGGRVVLGIGSGVGARIARLGFDYRPIAALRDAIQIIRPLLRGEEANHRGRVFSADRVRLGFRPTRPDMPIYFASMGDRSLALCGALADGLIISNMCPPGYSERAVAIVKDAAAAAARPL